MGKARTVLFMVTPLENFVDQIPTKTHILETKQVETPFFGRDFHHPAEGLILYPVLK